MGVPGEKPLGSTNSTHIWRRCRELNPATLVEGERSHHCAIPCSPNIQYHIRIMLLFVYTTTWKRFVIFKCRYFEFGL